MRISHKRKLAKKMSKWRPYKFCIETLIGNILAHDINQAFPKLITNELAFGDSSTVHKQVFRNWNSNVKEDTSVINLKSKHPKVSDYLCAQIHLLNVLCRNYPFRHTKPFIQLNTGSVLDKIITNINNDKTYSKGNCEPFKHLPLIGYNHSHIELFPYSRNRIFEDYSIAGGYKVENRTEIIKQVYSSLEKDKDLTLDDAVKQVIEMKAQAVLNKSVKKTGKVTGFWLISETINNTENYICITPHANSAFNNELIKSVVDTAKNYSR